MSDRVIGCFALPLQEWHTRQWYWVTRERPDGSVYSRQEPAAPVGVHVDSY